MYGQMAMQNMSMGQMVSMVNPPVGMGMGHAYQGTNADMMAGWGMNKISNIGAPLAAVGMGLAGVDPMSLAFKGGMAGMRFGVGGAIGGAALGAAAGGVAIGAVQHGIEQMYLGAQQQQQLNTTLHSNFQFMNQAGGRGFNRTQMANIGSEMRGMVGMDAMGASTGMEELTRFAGNMGSMGMGRGISDVREFTTKLKEMVRNAKTIATELSTSLEEAQQTMSSMRSSGVFKASDQLKMTGLMKSGSLFGISTAETGAMAQIGSQISRSIGGTGRNGAMAGAKMAVAVGGAVDTGMMTEEDIYNSTGLTGAEGRQAFGTRQLQLTGAFLQSSLGRRMYASVAGAGGRLNQNALGEYLGEGGFSTGGTMQHAYSNLGRVGRADFIHNEGKLRGSVMEADPFAAQRSMSGWLESKGMDMDDPRSKIFMQRRFAQMGIRLSNDEMDAQMSLMKNLPELEKQMEERQFQAGENRKKEIFRKHTGISGAKRKLEEAREHINNKLQEAGSNFYNELSESIERQINAITGQYVTEFSGNIDQAFKSGAGGDGSGMYRRTFGGSGNVGMNRLAGGQAQGAFKSGAGSLLKGFNSGFISDRMHYDEAGYRTASGGDATQDDLKRFENINRMANGVGDIDSLTVGDRNKSYLANIMASGKITGRGMDRLESIKKLIEEDAKNGKTSDVTQASTDILKALNAGKGEAGQMQKLVGLLRGSDLMTEDMRGAFTAPEAHSLMGSDGIKFRTAGDRHEAYGKMLTGGGESRESAFSILSQGYDKGDLLSMEKRMLSTTVENTKQDVTGFLEKGYTALSGKRWGGGEVSLREQGLARASIMDAISSLAPGGSTIGKFARGLAGETKEASVRGIGEYVTSKEGSALAARTLGTDKEAQGALDTINKQIASLNAKDESGKSLSQGEADKLASLEAMRSAALVNKELQRDGKLSREEAIKNVAKEQGKSEKETTAHVAGVVKQVASMQQENRDAVAKRLKAKGEQSLDSYTKTGLWVQGEHGMELDERVKKDVSGASQNILTMSRDLAEAKAGLGAGATQDQLDAVAAKEEALNKVMSSGSVAEKRARAKELRKYGGKDGSSMAGQMEHESKIQETLNRYQGAGKGVAAAKALGINTRELKGSERDILNKGDTESAVNLLMEKQGYGNLQGEAATKYKEQLSAALQTYKEKGAGAGASAFAGVDKSEVQKEKNLQKQKEENPLFDKMSGSLEKMAGILESAFPKQAGGQQNVFVTNAADIGRVAGPPPDGG